MSKKKPLDETEICEGTIINVGDELFVVETVNVTTKYFNYDCSSDWKDSTITIKCHVLDAEDSKWYIQEHHINTNDETHIIGWKIEEENGLSNMLFHPLPERRDTNSIIKLRHEAEENHVAPQYQAGFNLGWNACIDAITGVEVEV